MREGKGWGRGPAARSAVPARPGFDAPAPAGRRGYPRPRKGQLSGGLSPRGRVNTSPRGGHAMQMKRMGLALLALGAVAISGAVVAFKGATPATAAPVPTSGLHVSGNSLMDASNNKVVLWGVNRSGGEYACIPHGNPT